MIKYIFISILIINFAIFIWHILYVKKKCPKCGGILKLDRIDNKYGINITNKLLLTFRKYSDFKSTYICEKCGEKLEE